MPGMSTGNCPRDGTRLVFSGEKEICRCTGNFMLNIYKCPGCDYQEALKPDVVILPEKKE